MGIAKEAFVVIGGVSILLLTLGAVIGMIAGVTINNTNFERGRCVGYAEVQDMEPGWTAEGECILGHKPAGLVAESEAP